MCKRLSIFNTFLFFGFDWLDFFLVTIKRERERERERKKIIKDE